MIWDSENPLLLQLWAGFGLIFQNNVCGLLCVPVKFTFFVYNKGPNTLCVLDFDNSSHRE